jgi:amino acid adenylation domain-containing protein
VALRFESTHLTYRELNAKANQLARHLLAHDARGRPRVTVGMIVGICLERSLETVVAMLAILKIGAAYLPLDPAYPRERLNYILEDSGAALLVTDSTHFGAFGEPRTPVLQLDVERDQIERHDESALIGVGRPDDVAYVRYTSGSTGKPKGVEVFHRGLANAVAFFGSEVGIQADDTLLAVTPFSFDISELEIFMPLTHGAKCHVLSRAQAADGFQLRDVLEGATVMQATPATWHLVIEAGWTGSLHLRALCGGEALSQQLATELAKRTKMVWNCYGPTETTIWSTCWRVEPHRGSVSLGRPIANTRLYVLDAHREPVPVGVPGELFIGGIGVAKGYLNRPDLTRERFVHDPFVPTPGARMYRTGDRVKWSSDGQLEYIERLDHQVKIRGFRIELSEIEFVLEEHEGVNRCAVIVDQAGLDARLIGYYVPRTASVVDADLLRRHLRTYLPEPMVPSFLLPLSDMPLTTSGKIDRQALAKLAAERPQEAVVAAPRGDLERSLARLWASVLHLPAVDAQKSFFAQGGSSLQLARVQQQLRTELRYEVTVGELFAHPTIEELAAFIQSKSESRVVDIDKAVAVADRRDDAVRELESLPLTELEAIAKQGLTALLADSDDFGKDD